MNGFQTELARIEIIAHLTGEQQTAIELVGPLVVGAHELGGRSLVAGADARTTVAARVVERPDLSLTIADDYDRVVTDLHGEVVARLSPPRSHGR